MFLGKICTSFTINNSILSLLLFDPPAQPTGNMCTNKQNRDKTWAQVLACSGLRCLIFSTPFGTLPVQAYSTLQAWAQSEEECKPGPASNNSPCSRGRRKFGCMDASHPLPLSLGQENGSRLKAVVWITSFDTLTKNSICKLYFTKNCKNRCSGNVQPQHLCSKSQS